MRRKLKNGRTSLPNVDITAYIQPRGGLIDLRDQTALSKDFDFRDQTALSKDFDLRDQTALSKDFDLRDQTALPKDFVGLCGP